MITFCQTCSNNYAVFIHSKKNKKNPLLNGVIFPDGNPRNLRPNSLGQTLEIKHFKQSGRLPQKNVIMSELADITKNLKLKNIKV